GVALLGAEIGLGHELAHREEVVIPETELALVVGHMNDVEVLADPEAHVPPVLFGGRRCAHGRLLTAGADRAEEPAVGPENLAGDVAHPGAAEQHERPTLLVGAGVPADG